MHPLARLLTDGTPPRTWSMLVTIFGDLGLEPEARLSGPLLARLTEGMGIGPSALRTALHRLRREGWIESARAGRSTSHALTGSGRAQSLAARPRIYGDHAADALHLLLLEPGAALPEGAVAIMPGIALAGRPAGWSRPIDAPPGWIADRLLPGDLLALAVVAEGRFLALSDALETDPDLLDAAILRLLVVHLWRRVALRTPMLPDAAFPGGWRGARARMLAHGLLRRLPRPDVGALEAEAASARPPPRIAPRAQNGESGK